LLTHNDKNRETTREKTIDWEIGEDKDEGYATTTRECRTKAKGISVFLGDEWELAQTKTKWRGSWGQPEEKGLMTRS